MQSCSIQRSDRADEDTHRYFVFFSSGPVAFAESCPCELQSVAAAMAARTAAADSKLLILQLGRTRSFQVW